MPTIFARQLPDAVLTTLARHIDSDWVTEAYRRTRKSGAAGVDGQTADEYATNLEGNLVSLLDRAKSGDEYRAPPVRRTYIPKGKGGSRPIGIPTFEDKVLQRAVKMALEPVYEQSFLDCSYGFRPGRSAHHALNALWKGLMDMGGGWVLELDIQAFFDTVDHAALLKMLRKRVNDGVLVRLIGKWLKAGVLENGCIYHPNEGTPQGGVISPLLSNIYLHEVLDIWFEEVVKPWLSGRAFMVRFADDATLVFEREDDANRVMAVLGKRFARYGLTLHPEKTRLVPFRQPSASRDDQRPATFELLGFLHYWARSRKGNWVIKKKDGEQSLQPRAPSCLAVDAREPTLPGLVSASEAQCETARPLRLLRRDGQFARAGAVSKLGCAPMARSARAAQLARPDMGEVRAYPREISAPAADSSPFRASFSEPMTRGAGCGSSASPDLWEPPGSDSGGRPDSDPDPTLFQCCNVAIRASIPSRSRSPDAPPRPCWRLVSLAARSSIAR